MLILHPRSPVSYGLCAQTVTVYHRDGDTYKRTVYNQAFLDFRKTETTSNTGNRESNSFLLVIPGDVVAVSVGDKVMIGEGPAMSTREDWAKLIPATTPGLVVVQYVDPKYWNGRVVHTEAGG